jgi:hypothetical protein
MPEAPWVPYDPCDTLVEWQEGKRTGARSGVDGRLCIV